MVVAAADTAGTTTPQATTPALGIATMIALLIHLGKLEVKARSQAVGKVTNSLPSPSKFTLEHALTLLTEAVADTAVAVREATVAAVEDTAAAVQAETACRTSAPA